jgi:hypothetical protein
VNPIPLHVNGVPASRPTRRQTMQWLLAAVAASALPGEAPAQEVGRTVTPQENASRQPNPPARGYGYDPNLLRPHKPGDVWPLTFNDAQKKCAAALADTILPRDHLGPAASEVGVVEMIDEWISAPYPAQQADRPVILEGLAWLDAESQKRFQKAFVAISENEKRLICDDIAYLPQAKPEFKKGAAFFGKFRSLAAGAYYSTPPGWQAIGYVGNVALPRFDGPPPEVLAKLGVTQTVP